MEAYLNEIKRDNLTYKACNKEGCKKKVDIEKSLTIFRFPRILTIHLKRFYHSAMRREKISTTVKFPEVLDVSKYAPHSSKYFCNQMSF